MAIISLVSSSILFWVSGLPLLLIPFKAIFALQLWTFFTSIIVQADFIGLLFCCFVYAISSPPIEIKRGSVGFLSHIVTSALVINFAYVPVALLLAVVPIQGFARFGIVAANGAWPVLIMMMAENALADPTASTKFLCWDIPNKVYGWFIATAFSIMSFFPMLDMFIAVALAHAREGGGGMIA